MCPILSVQQVDTRYVGGSGRFSTYVLTLHLDPAQFEKPTDDEKNDVFTGHERFQAETRASGEFVETKAFAEPAETVTVRVRDGVAETSDGLYGEGPVWLCGYYVVGCETKERAIELAAQIPDAAHTGVEVRPVVHEDATAS